MAKNGNSIQRDAKGRFLPGQRSPNPNGRPKGAKERFTRDFIEAVANAFEEYGYAALVESATTKPSEFCRMCASLLPKEYLIEQAGTGNWVLNATPALDNTSWMEKHGISQDNQQVIEHDTSARKDN